MWNDNPKNVLILGHRGIRTYYPENTMISFRAAVDAGVDMIETDVQLSRDGVAVLCHDCTLDRTTNGTGPLKDLTFAELKALDAGSSKNPKFRGEQIPAFEELLLLVKDTPLLLNVEIKAYTHETVDESIRLLRKYGMAERSVIACFNAEIIRYTKATYPEMKTQGFPGRYMSDFTEETYDCMYGIGIPGEWSASGATEEDVRRDVELALSRGIHPWLFVSDTEETVKKCVDYGTYDVTGNDPFPALSYLPKVGLHKPIYENRIPDGEMTVADLCGVGDLRIERRPIPTCAGDEVLVEVRACGICGSDVGRVFTTGTYHFPTVPGHEFSGKVVYDKTGEMLGKRVAVFPLLPCFQCESCREEQYARCVNYDYYGSRRDGGFAQYIAVKRFNLVEIPYNVTYEEAAMCEPFAVAVNALSKLNVSEGDRVLITGAGPIGLIAARLATAAGAKTVEMIDSDPAKIRFAEERGFRAYSGGEVDRVLEGTGALLGKAVEAAKPFGQIVLMGNPAGDNTLPPKLYQMILRKELRVFGTWNSVYGTARNDWKTALSAISSGEIPVRDLITHRVPLEKCADALKMMKDKTEPYCKVMIENGIVG